MDNTTASTQQFCLRWHNHQTSLLSSLPLLLDQSHLTDITLSAEGKSLRAHRFVLSACSTFFAELFRTLDSSLHPVIVIPGASFATTIALLTFMYSGEVNVFEEQIPSLLSLAETLGIKGLADFNNSSIKSPKPEPGRSLKDSNEFKPTDLSTKIPSPLQNLFFKSFHLYPNLMCQPLNFSQSALNKTSEILSKYQRQCNTSEGFKENNDTSLDLNSNKKTILNEKKLRENKKIDKIAESLRDTSNKTTSHPSLQPKLQISIPNSSPNFMMVRQPQTPQTPTSFSSLSHNLTSEENTKNVNDVACTPQNTRDTISTSSDMIVDKSPANTINKPSNSKLYATCFICHKQLSNQYNLRVHLETHQNVRYACNVCSHVSRSKDALRKHVSYRHPGAPSPCESESRRKRTRGLGSNLQLCKSEANNISSQSQSQQQQLPSHTLTNPSFMLFQEQYASNYQLPKSEPNSPATPPAIINELNCLNNQSTQSERSDSV